MTDLGPAPGPSAPPLVARSVELGAIEEALRSAQRGRPAVVHLVAEAGLGKTRLLAEALRVADAAGMAVLHGTADERDRGRPFGAAGDPIADYLATLPARQREALTDRDDPLGKALRSGRLFEQDSHSLGARGVGSLLRSILAGLASRRPLLLALDDVHWADEGSIDVMAGLSSRPPHASVVVLLAYRPTRAVTVLESVRPGSVELEGHATMHRLRLEPLSVADLADLLPDVGSTRRRQLFDVCGGNPFFLRSLLQVSGPLDHTLGTFGALPPPVHRALATELDSVPDEHRPVLDVSAVVGDPFDASLVGAVTGMGDDVAAVALDEMRALDLVIAESTGRWRFRHPLLRRVAYEEIPTSARTQIHRRAASVLAARGATLAAQARHLMMCAEPGDRGAAELMISAADDLAAQAPAQAAAWFAAALRLVPDGGERGADYVRLALAQAEVAVGRLGEARVIVHEVLASLEPSDDRRLAATVLAARIEHLMGRNSESAALLLRELGRPDGGPSSGRAALQLELATTWLMDGSFADARESAELALGLLTDRDIVLRSVAAGTIALASVVAGDTAAAGAVASAAARELDGLSDSELALSLEAGVWLGWAEMFLERLPHAQRHLDRCLSIARRGAHQHLLPHLLVGYGSVLKSVGALVDASEAYDEAAEAADRLASAQSRAMTRTMQCRAATWLGELETAQRLGAEAVDLATGPGSWFASVAVATLAQARLAAGNPVGCAQSIVDAGGGRELPQFDPGSRCDWWEVATRASVATGDLAAARDFVDRATDAAAQLSGLTAPAGFASLARATLLAAQDDHEAAASAAGDAAERFQRTGLPIEVARAELLAGESLAQLGRRAEALVRLESADAAFAACSAANLQAQTRAVMRRLGRRVPRPRQSGSAHPGPGGALGVLSKREREVAVLVAAGRSNRQIASELVVSEKTVESHLAHIFTKLDVASRAAVATLVGSDPALTVPNR